MNENNPNMKMFVADTLMDGIETFSDMLTLLNHPGVGGWSNVMTRDVTVEEMLSLLEEVIRLGFVDVWRNDAGGLIAIGSGVDVVDILASATEDKGSVWFHLTQKGREAVEAWEPPKTFKQFLIEYVQSSPASHTSLYSAYQWLNQHTDQRLNFAKFANLIDFMLQYDYLRLWQSGNSGNNSQDQADMVRVLAMPTNLNPGHKLPEAADAQTEPWGYFLTLGDAPTSVPELEPLAQIADPKDLISELIERNPHLLSWFTEHKDVRHIVINRRNGVTIGVGSVSEFRAKVRWGKGLPEVENDEIRHIVLDETGNVVRDYYGPASSDPYL